MMNVNVSAIMQAAGIDLSGTVIINKDMSGVESNPKDDWLYLGLKIIRDIAKERGGSIFSAAGIGSGNGIIELAMLHKFPVLETLYVTDILKKILPTIQKNIEQNVPRCSLRTDIQYLAGPDCTPLPKPVDFIYANLPLMMVDEVHLRAELATTTLTDTKRYALFSTGKNDELLRWSLISQLGFLLTAKEKLNAGGSVITLIGGRIPYDVICEVFDRAQMKYRQRYCAFKRQSDPQFIAEYATHERSKNIEFAFYDYETAAERIRESTGLMMPDTFPLGHDALMKLITNERITACEAEQYALAGKTVGHIAFVFEVML